MKENLAQSTQRFSEDTFIRVASLDELEAKQMMVVRGERGPILVIYANGGVYAVDNRCPHLGFPLHRGSVEDCILTCHWHHARFDLASGGTFDLWADDLPTAPVEVRDGEVWVATRARYHNGDAHWRNRLQDGMAHNISLVIAKSILGLTTQGVDDRELVRHAALFGARQRDGWGVGLTILTALANLLPMLPQEERYLALYQGIRRVARDCADMPPRRDRQALGGGSRPSPMLARWLRHWTLVRHRDGVERTMLTAIAGDGNDAELATLLLIAATDRAFAAGGHVLDFMNKAFECLDLIGWEHAAHILPTLTEQLVEARGAEESNAWRHPIDLVQLLDGAIAELPARVSEGMVKRGGWRDWTTLAHAMLGDEPAGIIAAIDAAVLDGAAPIDLSRALSYAASLRIARFGISNEHSDWDTALHCFTYCNALHQMLKRVARGQEGRPSDLEADLLRGVYHGAMQVYLTRFLNVPPAPLPGKDDAGLRDLPDNPDILCRHFLEALDRHGSVDTAARVVVRYLSLGEPAAPLLTTLAHSVLREDADFHTYQMLEGGLRQHQEWEGSAEAWHVLIAVARYLAAHAPTERAQLQTATVARKLSRGQPVHEDLGSAP